MTRVEGPRTVRGYVEKDYNTTETDDGEGRVHVTISSSRGQPSYVKADSEKLRVFLLFCLRSSKRLSFALVRFW